MTNHIRPVPDDRTDPHLSSTPVDVAASRTRNTRRRRTHAAAARIAASVIAALTTVALVMETATPTSPVFQPGPVGMRHRPGPQIMALANAIRADPADHAVGRYAYVTAVRWTRSQPDWILAEDIQRWTANDESGATASRKYPVPAYLITEDTGPPDGFGSVPATVTVNPGWPQHLPTREITCPPGSTLRDQLQGPQPDKEPAARLMQSVVDAQLRTVYSLNCRRAVLRTLAVTAGTHLTGPVLDPLGRPGTAVDTAGDGIRHRLIVDTEAGIPLAYTAWHDGTGPWSGLTEWIVLTTATRTRHQRKNSQRYDHPGATGNTTSSGKTSRHEHSPGQADQTDKIRSSLSRLEPPPTDRKPGIQTETSTHGDHPRPTTRRYFGQQAETGHGRGSRGQ